MNRFGKYNIGFQGVAAMPRGDGRARCSHHALGTPAPSISTVSVRCVSRSPGIKVSSQSACSPLSDFGFRAATELIAQTALPEAARASASKWTARRSLRDQRPPFCRAATASRPASAGLQRYQRLKAALGQKASGGKIEVLVERLTGERTGSRQIRASKSPAQHGAASRRRVRRNGRERVERSNTLHFPPMPDADRGIRPSALPPYNRARSHATDERAIKPC